MKIAALTMVVVMVIGLAGFQSQPKVASGSDFLLKLEAEFEQTAAEKGFEGFMSYFTDDSYNLPNGGNIVQGTENIRQAIGPWEPGFTLTWKPVKAEMAASGDLGYTFGNYVATSTNKDGKTVKHYGKYVTIWKKQADGKWKVAMDTGNNSPAPKTD